MDYNTSLDKIIIREYGRNVQKMIAQTLSIESKEERTMMAKAIIKVMSQLNPSGKESADYWHRLWDHLHIMAEFQLDVDSPYPKPDVNPLTIKPEPLPYPKNKIKFPPYGKNIELMIEKAKELEEGPEKEAFVNDIANHLKRQYLNWNRDSVNDSLIIEHLNILSRGKLKLSEDFKFINTRDVLMQNEIQDTAASRHIQSKKKQRKSGKQNRTYFKKK
ncbi:MAG: DUF4290 domain-containing protein [Bacteroidales bacterium]|nr:DUF4290 domain-containing protein [Bacteroidales bacterium]MDY0217434.1 DUF4290 domain-containing protein [Bacteroidales bacterium]